MALILSKAVPYVAVKLAAGTLTAEDIARLVAAFQVAEGLAVDGMPGPVTLGRLRPPAAASGGAGFDAALARARSMIGRGGYGLGHGPASPDAATPFDSEGKCDCSAFVAWCFRLPKKSADGVYFYTDQIEADAGPKPVKGDLGDGVPWAQGRPGDIVCYGAGSKTGHMGIVSARDASGPTMAIHCRSGIPPAVVETSIAFFLARDAVIFRLRPGAAPGL